MPSFAVIAGQFLGTLIGEATKIAAPVVVPLILAELQKGNTGEVGKANEAANAMLPSIPVPAADNGVRSDASAPQHDASGSERISNGASEGSGSSTPDKRW